MKKIWFFLLLMALFFIAFIIVLYQGVRIDNLSFSNIKMTGLYIKLDKKFFVAIDDIKITSDVTKSNDNSSLDFIALLDYFPAMDTFFETISISDIQFGKERAVLEYKNGSFYVNSSRADIKTKLDFADGGKLELLVEEVLLKDINAKINGKLTADTRNKIYDFTGFYDAFDIKGRLGLSIKNGIVDYRLSSSEFQSPEKTLNYIRTLVDIPNELANWIYGYIKARTYRILSLEGKFDISTRNAYPRLLKARVAAKDANVTFHQEAPFAFVKDVAVDIQNNKIVFLIDEAEYEGEKVDAYVEIYNLISGETGVNVDLKTNAYFDESINKILKAYIDVELPIRQTGGKSNSHVNIDVKLSDIDVNVIGNFTLENANVSLGNAPLFSPYTHINLNNSMLYFTKSQLVLDDIFDVSANGTLNASAKHMDADSVVNHLLVKARNNSIVSLSNISTPFTLDILEDFVSLYFVDFNTTLEFGNKSIITLNSLEKFYNYSPLMQKYSAKNGSVTIESSNFESLKGRVHIGSLPLPLFLNDTQITSFSGTFDIEKEELNVISYDEKIEAKLGKNTNITLKDLDLKIKTNNENSNASNNSMPIELRVINGKIYLTPNATLLSDNTLILLSENGSVIAENKYKKGHIRFLKDTNILSINGTEVRGDFLNSLANKKMFSGGAFDINVNGTSADNFTGNVSIKDTKLIDFVFINNMMAFLNTIPSFATLSDPGYSSTGFPVHEGIAKFQKNGDMVHINELLLKGYSSDAKGKGYISTKTNEVYLELQISVMKGISNIIDFIPLVDFIILGEDKAVSTNVIVRGTLDDPKIETNVISDTVMSPFNIIKRVFQLPLYLFE